MKPTAGRVLLRWLARGLVGCWAGLAAAAPPASPPSRPLAVPVHLYVSPATQAWFARIGGRYDALVKPWRDLLAAASFATREVDRLDGLSGEAGGVLVLPSAVALGAAERRALLRFRREGGSILATWATGARDAEGAWQGYGFVRELVGVAVDGEIDKDARTRFLIPYGETPVNRSVPAGRRLWLGQLGERPLRLSGGVEAAAYMDWARTVLRTGDHHSAIVYDEAGPGRVVMFGFAETAWDFHPEEMRALAGDAVRWLRRQPGAKLAAWPHSHRAAQLIEMDTEEGFGNAIHFAELMESMNAAGTFYCLTSEARRHRALVRQLAARHEIGFHGEVHIGFKGLSRAKQQARLERMFSDMREILGAADVGWPPGAGHGFRAPTEAYDDTTETLLLAMGLRHHVVDPNRSADRLPMFAAVAGADPSRDLVVLPRGQLDDLNYVQLKLDDDQIGAALIGEYEMNLRMAGLAVLSVHSQNFADPDRLLGKPQHTALMTHALEDLARHVGPRHDRVWMAPGGRIAQWWRERSRATLAARAEGGQLALELEVTGATPIEGLTVRVDHPREEAVPTVRPAAATAATAATAASAVPAVALQATAPAPVPQVRRIDRFSSALVFATAAPGRHRYVVTFP
ncbi:MAG: polysaccharide deacetylase family protein [Burkholderiales bacterium]|nr:polysaccharide deacetylase family protein [Burkholderiales bacterium]